MLHVRIQDPNVDFHLVLVEDVEARGEEKGLNCHNGELLQETEDNDEEETLVEEMPREDEELSPKEREDSMHSEAEKPRRCGGRRKRSEEIEDDS